MKLMMHYAVISLLASSLLTNVAPANDQFTVVLHARTPGGFGTCTEAGLPDCKTIRPTTQVAAGADFRLYIFVNNYVGTLAAMQTAFEWPGDWLLDPDGKDPVTIGCQMHQIQLEPSNPGGPVNGTYVTAFDCIQGPSLAPITRMDFRAGMGGCLRQINPLGNQQVQIVDCPGNSYFIDPSDPVQQRRLGSICVGTPGHDACDVLTTPVEPATWGRIKATY
jgi:hypothetical protein